MWLNLVERWSGKITAAHIRGGVSTGVPQLERAIHAYIAEVQTEDGKLDMFVAVDRTSKFAYAELHPWSNYRESLWR